MFDRAKRDDMLSGKVWGLESIEGGGGAALLDN